MKMNDSGKGEPKQPVAGRLHVLRGRAAGSYSALFYFVASHEDCSCHWGLLLIEILNYNHIWKKEKYFDMHLESPRKPLISPNPPFKEPRRSLPLLLVKATGAWTLAFPDGQVVISVMALQGM